MIEFGSRHNSRIPIFKEGNQIGSLRLVHSLSIWVSLDSTEWLTASDHRAIAAKLDELNGVSDESRG